MNQSYHNHNGKPLTSTQGVQESFQITTEYSKFAAQTASIKGIMDTVPEIDQEEALIHSMLHLELPDPDNELFVQIDPTKNLSQFTLFPNLPKELRLKIWYYTLPPLKLNDISEKFKATHDDIGPPITLQINQERRGEALRNFSVIVEETTSFFTNRDGKRICRVVLDVPLVLDHHQTAVRLDMRDWHSPGGRLGGRRVEFVKSRSHPRAFNKFTTLELRSLDFNDVPETSYREDAIEAFYLVTKHFPNLEQFILTIDESFSGAWIDTEIEDECMVAAQAAVVMAANERHLSIVPGVCLRDWMPIESPL